MQVDEGTVDRYKKEAPELLDAVTSGEAKYIMKRDEKTDYCIKYDKGWCKIHADKGTNFLGDACHFFPRISREFGDEVLMGASMACPEVVRNVLRQASPFARVERNEDRLPFTMKSYELDGMTGAQASEIITEFIDMAGNVEITPERAVMRIVAIVQSLETFPQEKWPEVVPFLIKMADTRLSLPEESKNDPYYVLQTLRALVHASKPTSRPRFEETFESMERALGMVIDRETLDVMLNVGQEAYPKELNKRWKQGASSAMQPVLRRWLQAQIAMFSMPFSGFGRTMMERAVVLCVRFATVKLALMSLVDEKGNAPDEAACVKAIQSLSRFMDHLADPELTINMYEDAGWLQPARLRGLVGDA
jgi:lysine-N-methylase